MSYHPISTLWCPVVGGSGDVTPPNFDEMLSGGGAGDVTPSNFNAMLRGGVVVMSHHPISM